MIKHDSGLPCMRHLFEIPEDRHYLNCAYMAPSLKVVSEAGRLGVLRKERPWEITPRHFFEESDRVRSLFAQLIEAQPEDVALIPSVSYGIGIAAKNLVKADNRAVMVLEEQFPSNIYPWRAAAHQLENRVVSVPRRPDGNWTQAILSRLDGRFSVAAFPNCHWSDGSLVDLEMVGARCRQLEIPLVVDATQSLGAMPLSVKKVKPAVLVCAAYKWLLGPYSLSFLYVDPAYQKMEPLEYNWITRKDSEDFAGLVNYTDTLSPGAVRYDVGERSNPIQLPMAEAALSQILEWGVERIYKKLSDLNNYIADEVSSLGFKTFPRDHRAGHLLGIRHPRKLPPNAGTFLAERNVHVSVRGDAVRISPHLYTSEKDVAALLDGLRQLLEQDG